MSDVDLSRPPEDCEICQGQAEWHDELDGVWFAQCTGGHVWASMLNRNRETGSERAAPAACDNELVVSDPYPEEHEYL